MSWKVKKDHFGDLCVLIKLIAFDYIVNAMLSTCNLILFRPNRSQWHCFLFLDVRPCSAFWLSLATSLNTNHWSPLFALSTRSHWSELTAQRSWENGLVCARLTKKANPVRFADVHASSSRPSAKKLQLWTSSRTIWDPTKQDEQRVVTPEYDE